MFQLLIYHCVQFYWWGKPEYPEKTTDLPHVTDNILSYNVESSTPHQTGFEPADLLSSAPVLTR